MSAAEGRTTLKDERLRCAECGRRLEESDKECPNCGSTEKTSSPINFVRKAQVAIGVRDFSTAVHEIHMTPESWTILGLILGFIIPPLFYGIFYLLTINFWFKVVIWLGITFLAFGFTRTYILVKSLRYIAGKGFGKRKIKG